MYILIGLIPRRDASGKSRARLQVLLIGLVLRRDASGTSRARLQVLLGECMVRSEHRLEVAGALPLVAVGAPRLAAEAYFGGCRHATHVSLPIRAPHSRGARQTCFPHATTVHRSEVFYGCCERTSHCVGLLTTLRPPQPRWRKQIWGKRCQGVSAAPARSLGCWWPPSVLLLVGTWYLVFGNINNIWYLVFGSIKIIVNI